MVSQSQVNTDIPVDGPEATDIGFVFPGIGPLIQELRSTCRLFQDIIFAWASSCLHGDSAWPLSTF
jgi:hypothetical protein